MPGTANLERLAMMLGYTASWGDERLLVGSQEEDRRSQSTRHAHRRGRPPLRRGPLDRQALPRRGPRREVSGSQKAPRLKAQAGRTGRKAFGDGSRRAAGGDPPPKTRVLGAGSRGKGERLDSLAGAQAPGMEPKKRSVGATERDEFLRAPWRALVARR